MSKKVLIVTYYWPPAGGPGVQRWLYFTKYLSHFDIKPVVFIPKNPDYPIVDESLSSELGKEVEVITYPIVEPYALAKRLGKKNASAMSKGILPNEDEQTKMQKAMLWVRGNCFVPDARVLWVKPALSFLNKYVGDNEIDTVITTGPPHSVHLIGLGLKKRFRMHWLADFRDPWTTIGYHDKLKLGKRAEKKHLALEKEVLDKSDMLLVTSEGTAKHFRKKTRTPIKVITNGYEPITDHRKIVLDSKFTISHIGSLLSDRNPKILWEVLGELVKEEKKFAKSFQLQLAGVVSDTVIDAIEYHGLGDFLDNKGYVSHQEALNLQQTTQLLLLIEIDSEETKQIIPGKIFEYLRASRPVIALAPEGSEVSNIIKETASGDTFNYTAKEALKTHIYNCFRLFEKKSLKTENVSINKYTRKSLTEQLSIEIKKLWEL